MSIGMTVIRGSGDGVEVVINGVVKQEIARQNKLREAERQRANLVELRRNQMLTERRAVVLKKIFGNPSFLHRAMDKLGNAYCMAMATIIELGIRFGLWEYVPEDED